MNQSDQVNTKKKKRRKRTLDKDKIAKNKLKIKEKKRKEKLQKRILRQQLRARKVKLRKGIGKGIEIEAVKEEELSAEATAAVNEQGEAEGLQETGTASILGRKKRFLAASLIFAAVLIGGGTAFGIFYSRWRKRVEQNAAVEATVSQVAQLANYSKAQYIRDIVRKKMKKDIPDVLEASAALMIDRFRSLPPQIRLTEENTADFATIESCRINPGTGKVEIKITTPGYAVSDDRYYYLFEEKIYDTALSGEDYIIEEKKDTELTFSVNLNYNSANSRLFSKFVLAVKKNGEYVAISKPKFITNPEAIAKYNPSFPNTTSKKGLLVDPLKIRGSELDDLGVKHAAYNIFLSRIVGNTTNANYPTIHYTYNGKSYAFNGQIMSEYDLVFSTLTNKGITISAIILNDMSSATMNLIHPLARSGGRAPYYAFNAADDAGVEYMAAIASFLANRYSGSNGYGKVMNWIIGNEINARSEWNYIQYMDTESYTNEYAKAFRVFYNAILSINGNARVYISLDQQWGKSLYSSNGYASKDILDAFNRNIKAGGNIDWAVAQHPYNYPLTAAAAWSTSGRAGSYIVNSETSPVLSIRNINVLSDYLQKEDMLTEDGKVRHIILSEMGYTSSSGQEIQAASFVYAYKIIEANQYIDSMLFSRETDAASEVAQGLAFGLCTQDGGRKSIYDAYKYVDTGESAAHTDFALRVIGISSWGEVIRHY